MQQQPFAAKCVPRQGERAFQATNHAFASIKPQNRTWSDHVLHHVLVFRLSKTTKQNVVSVSRGKKEDIYLFFRANH